MTTRISIRAKLAVALFIPVLATFAVSIYEVDQANRELDEVRQDTALARAALGPKSLIRTLQDERNDSAITAVGLRDSAILPTEDLAGTRESVDAAREEFGASLADSGPRAEAVYASALEAYDATVADLRTRFDADTNERNLDNLELSNQMWAGYTDTIDSLIEANTRLTLEIEDPELRSAAAMLDALSREVNDLGVMVRTAIISSLGGDEIEGTTQADVIATINQFRADQERVTTLSRGSYGDVTEALADNPAYRDTVELLETYVDTGELDTPTVVETVSARPEPNLDTAAQATTAALTARANELVDAAEARRRNFIALSIGVALAGGLIMVLAARSITRPLRSLTRQADTMASERLPTAVQEILDTPVGEDVVIPEVEPVKVKTRDEVREVAHALNTVQTSALDLAVEQAVLRRNIADSFVNLGRRTQILIGRQLDFITELERNETDADVLDDLFTLDHLATRARRNAESLVVLAGLATPRTWSAPIAMADVLRAALSEVEDYQRVEIRTVDPATVPGRTATDLVHLLAELLENGLSFSPPGRPVEVHGRMTRNGYLVVVIDQGIGMTGEERERANRRLAGEESYTVAPSRYLGHYVAGSLAQRIGVGVSLDESPTGGIAAKIRIPSNVLDEVPALPSPADAGDPDGSGPVPPVATTEHGLPRRVRPPGSASDAEPTLEAPRERSMSIEAAVPVPDSSPAPVETTPEEPSLPAAPAEASATGPESGTEPPTPGTTPAETRAARADLWRSYGPRRATDPVPTASQDPSAPPTLDPEPVVDEPETRPTVGVTAVAPPWTDDSAPPSSGPETETEAAAGSGTTANGLTRRVPGDRLAATPRTISIPRGRGPATTAVPPADVAPPADSAAADSMFSLLSVFESGSQRGRSELDLPTDEVDPTTGTSHDDKEEPS